MRPEPGGASDRAASWPSHAGLNLRSFDPCAAPSGSYPCRQVASTMTSENVTGNDTVHSHHLCAGGKQAANTLEPDSSSRYATTANTKRIGSIEASLLVVRGPCLFSHGSYQRRPCATLPHLPSVEEALCATTSLGIGRRTSASRALLTGRAMGPRRPPGPDATAWVPPRWSSAWSLWSLSC